MAIWIDWQKLEQTIPLNELPTFQREFLKEVRPEENWDDVFLRKVQSRFQASLKQLEREGRVKREGDSLFLDSDLIPEAFKRYLD